MDIHTLLPSQPAGLLVLAAVTLTTLAVMLGLGWLLVPQKALPAHKLLLLAARLASGMVFVTGIAALFCLRHMNYMTWLSLAQALTAVWLWRKPGQACPEAEETRWSWREIAGVAVICAVLLPVFQVPYQYSGKDGEMIQLHADLGYFVDTIVALPEAQAANGWAIFMGKDAAAATGTKDAWYHWGSLMLAVGIRGITGLPAAPVMLIVVNALLNVLLILSAAALARSVTRLSMIPAILAGAAAITCVQLLRSPQIFELLAYWLPYDIFHHARVPLALIFPYKFEGVLVLCALALWQSGQGKAALGMIYLAACSAPHTVATGGASLAMLGGLGLILRDGRMFRAGTFGTLVLLAGWASVHFGFRSSLPATKSEAIVGFIGFDHLWKIFQHGLLDSAVSLLLSSLLLVGALFLIHRGRRENLPEQRLLGWLCFCGIIGSSIALQGMRSADRFHVVVMTHAMLVMPVCAVGLVAMLRSWEGRSKLLPLALVTAVTLMGTHTLLLPAVTRQAEPWHLQHLAEMRQHLKGAPFGYFAKADRNWWISKHSQLAGMLDSRVVRLNPIDESKTSHFSEAAYRIPFDWVPPGKEEGSSAWSIRLARKLGIRHVVETYVDRLPRRVREQCKPLWAGPGIMLYELPQEQDTAAQVTSSQP